MPCPTSDVLDRFTRGALTRHESEQLETHLGTCSSCSNSLESQGDRILLGDLRRAAHDSAPEWEVVRESGLPPSQAWIDGSTGLGRYRILKKIGEGGMGIVYEAEQQAPKRRVALKVLRPLASSARTVERFRLEAEILGRLEHAGIAKIYEAGTFDAGFGPQAFLAMELIDGLPLDEHVRGTGLERRGLLELFIRICAAVQHVHEKGVIHRDLKPSNVLVDRDGAPKVVDFGVARLEESDRSAVTKEGQI